MTDKVRRFRNDTGETIVWNEVGHAISPGQDVEIFLASHHKPPTGVTETTHTAREPVPAAKTEAHGPEAVLASEPGLEPVEQPLRRPRKRRAAKAAPAKPVAAVNPAPRAKPAPRASAKKAPAARRGARKR
jgi:hypothetical protein